jgi:hypothetical protein
MPPWRSSETLGVESRVFLKPKHASILSFRQNSEHQKGGGIGVSAYRRVGENGDVGEASRLASS